MFRAGQDPLPGDPFVAARAASLPAAAAETQRRNAWDRPPPHPGVGDPGSRDHQQSGSTVSVANCLRYHRSGLLLLLHLLLLLLLLLLQIVA